MCMKAERKIKEQKKKILTLKTPSITMNDKIMVKF